MTQEEKDLLLKDLSARLPYGVICNDNRHGSGRVTYIDVAPDDIEQKNGKVIVYYDFDEFGELKNCKPYLRSMSSMTEEEVIEFNNIPSTKNYQIVNGDLPWDVANYKQIDWLNKKMFDYRGLIPKGLAIEVTKENNPYKD